ncbi:MAG: hypothetical protein J1D88_08655 [Treponema sp.]|nr:hypothetical protein [Treponema sp.]
MYTFLSARMKTKKPLIAALMPSAAAFAAHTDVNEQDEDGKTTPACATERGATDVAELLKAADARQRVSCKHKNSAFCPVWLHTSVETLLFFLADFLQA